MIVRLLPAAVAIASLALLAGCSSDEPEAPKVPPIESPKGLVGLDPCTLVDGSARSTLGLGPGVPGTDELGANCRWSGQSPRTVQLTSYTSGDGLSDLTKKVDPAASRVRLSGYPALETFTTGGRFCRYDIGVAEREAIVATMDGGEPDSCTALQELLSAVLSRRPASR
ncbi:MAG TPA: DUF3558 family protein [Actinophytocola sp.]|uniref:DUF3558 family protein n=1 Tax=Actinophytocola sp. TaxID=1872138 RepID=UPI002F92E31D